MNLSARFSDSIIEEPSSPVRYVSSQESFEREDLHNSPYPSPPCTMKENAVLSPPNDSHFSCTQDAINCVGKDISDLKNSLRPQISVHHKAVVDMGRQVSELKKEVVQLRDRLDQSQKMTGHLKRRLTFFEQKEEEDLVNQSIAYEREQDMSYRHTRYAKYGPQSFSRRGF